MVRINFYRSDGLLTGFLVEGHSGYADEGSDIVCAAVSSASYLVANTITEIMGIDADTKVKEAYLSFKISPDDAEKTKDILEGFELHVKALEGDYKKYISVKE